MLPCSSASIELLKAIAETGDLDKIEWSDLQLALKGRFKSVLECYTEKSKDVREEEFQENFNEKFDSEACRDEILELINSFNEAPFTIQRVCELLYSPFTHYDRLGTFLRGLEKNLRVTSSNSSWPDERKARDSSNSSETTRNDINVKEVDESARQSSIEESISELKENPPQQTSPPVVLLTAEAASQQVTVSAEHEDLDLENQEQVTKEQLNERLDPIQDEKNDNSPMGEEVMESASSESLILENECQENKI